MKNALLFAEKVTMESVLETFFTSISILAILIPNIAILYKLYTRQS